MAEKDWRDELLDDLDKEGYIAVESLGILTGKDIRTAMGVIKKNEAFRDEAEEWKQIRELQREKAGVCMGTGWIMARFIRGNMELDSMNEYFTEAQKENLQYFQENLSDFLANPLYKHKFAIIANKKLIGIYDNFNNAIEEAVSSLRQGEYVIQQIIGENEIINFLYPAIAIVTPV